MSSRAIFLDRDGTINVDYGYLYRPADLKFIDGAVEAMHRFIEAGFKIVIITNQSGIGRGYFTREQYDQFEAEVASQLRSAGIELTATMMCPHSPDEECTCRKPNPTMVLEAAREHDIDVSASYMFGDKPSDVKCGEAAGVTSYLITAEHSLQYWAEKILG